MALLNGTRDRERLRLLWQLGWPAIIEQILGTMVSYVDTAMVGSMGANGTAAVSVNGPALWLSMGAMFGLGVGYSVQMANAVGAGDADQGKRIIQQGFLAALVSGLVALLVYEGLGGYIPLWMGAREEIRLQSIHYLRIYALAYPFMAFQGIFSSILRATGNSKTPLLINTQTNIINTVLNFFLIYPTRVWGGFTIPFLDLTVGKGLTIPGLGWGVEGAAAASAIAISVGGVRTALACFRQKGYETGLTRSALKPDRPIIHRALRLGLPSAGEEMVINLGQIAMTALVAHNLTTVALAANSIATVAEDFCFRPAMGIGFAAVALVGQSVGAGDREDVEAYGHLGGALAVFVSAILSLIMFIFCPVFMRAFNSDLNVVTEAARALRVMLVVEPFFAAANGYSGALRGVNDTKFPMIVGLVCMWCIRVPLAFLFILKLHMGLVGVWLAMACDLSGRGILSMVRWYRKRWVGLCGLEGQKG